MNELDPSFWQNLLTVDNLEKLLFLLAGLLIREIFNFIKNRVSKGPEPKIDIQYSSRCAGSHGTAPRMYKYEAQITIKNISNIFAYDLCLDFKSPRWKRIIDGGMPIPELINRKSLEPKESWILSTSEEIACKDYMSLEVKPGENDLMPDYFRNVELTLTYRNEKERNFILNFINN